MQPVLFVLFASTATATGVGLAEDLSKGIVDRFRSLPMARGTAPRTLGHRAATGRGCHRPVSDAQAGEQVLLAAGARLLLIDASLGSARL